LLCGQEKGTYPESFRFRADSPPVEDFSYHSRATPCQDLCRMAFNVGSSGRGDEPKEESFHAEAQYRKSR